MERIRRTHTPDFKVEVALAAARGDKTQLQLAEEYGIHTSQVRRWHRQLLKQSKQLFERKRRKHGEN